MYVLPTFALLFRVTSGVCQFLYFLLMCTVYFNLVHFTDFKTIFVKFRNYASFSNYFNHGMTVSHYHTEHKYLKRYDSDYLRTSNFYRATDNST